jgi:hypothetical protein
MKEKEIYREARALQRTGTHISVTDDRIADGDVLSI